MYNSAGLVESSLLHEKEPVFIDLNNRQLNADTIAIDSLVTRIQTLANTPAEPQETYIDRSKNDREARHNIFGEVYQQTRSRIVSYVLKISARDNSLTDEVVQDTYLRAWQNIDRYEPKAPFMAWLYTIARNSTYSHTEIRQRNAKHRAGVLYEGSNRGVMVTHLLAYDGEPKKFVRYLEDKSAEHDYDAFDARQMVEHLLMELPQKLRQVVELRSLNNLEYSEIAASLGVKEATVRQHHHRALMQMRKIMGSLQDAN